MKSNTWFWCLINTSLTLLVAIYVFITKDFGAEAYNRCEELEKELALQKERCDYMSSFITKKDSIVININYSEKKAVTPIKK
jgi:hypothetical protein